MADAMAPAGSIGTGSRPGSPWMPTPSSIWSPCSATPKLRPRSITRCARSRTCASGAPSAARAPAIFSTTMVTPVPRRGVSESAAMATSSSTTTASTSMPSSPANSAAIRKFRMSPV